MFNGIKFISLFVSLEKLGMLTCYLSPVSETVLKIIISFFFLIAVGSYYIILL